MKPPHLHRRTLLRAAATLAVGPAVAAGLEPVAAAAGPAVVPLGGWSGDGYKGTRGIRTATSPDARRWSELRPLEYTDPAFVSATHLYTNAIKPYPRAPHLLVGLPVRYVEKAWDESLRSLPQPADRRRRSDAQERYGTALTETLLMTSRDGVRFAVHEEAFLRPGIERDGTWMYGQQYRAYQLVETRSALDPRIKELSLYATEGYWHGRGSMLRRHTLRLDGFASLHAGRTAGELVTPPLVFAGSRLTLNLSTAAAGSVRVALERPDCGPLAGSPVRLRVRLAEADLFAVQFIAASG